MRSERRKQASKHDNEAAAMLTQAQRSMVGLMQHTNQAAIRAGAHQQQHDEQSGIGLHSALEDLHT